MASTLNPQEFVAKWRQVQVKERSGYQTHFNDLCALVGHDDPVTADPSGTWFAFEFGANKQSGGQGWADVFKKGFFALEYKGKHANLDKAYQQLLQYREALQNPPLLIVSDMDVIEIHTNFTNTVKQVYRLTLDDLLTPAGQRTLRNVFYEAEAFRAPQTTIQVTERAAAEFAKLAEQLRKWGEEPQKIAHFLIRLLFCLFAEDIRLLPEGLFSRLIKQTRSRPALFVDQLRQLFQAMAKGGFFAMEDIPYFNGRLFDNDEVLELDSDGIGILERVSKLDWSSIEPAIFGTLFERSLDPSKRSQLGAHYTSRDDILLIVEPVLMQPLRRRWAEVKEQARALAEKRGQASGGQRTKLETELQRLVLGFQDELAQVRVLDPACGSGNFLYVALKQLLDLEKEVRLFMVDIGLTMPATMVGPEQLYGIEINEYAHELAQVTVWIGFIQWLRDNGFGRPSEPILKPLNTIRRMDAILAFDNEGKPIEPDWPPADVIIGNPPFLGGKRMRRELGDGYVDNLFSVYEKRVPREADLVLYWFEKGRNLIENRSVKRVGLLGTQGIRGGANRRVLEDIKRIGNIFLAWSDKDWVLDGAAVHVSIVGFDIGEEKEHYLNGNVVSNINPDLTASINIGQAKILNENRDISFMGVTPAAPFDIPGAIAIPMINAQGNPNGRSNREVVKPYYNGHDLTRRPRNYWIIDFGDMSLEDASMYELPFKYANEIIRPYREKSRIANQPWWKFTRGRPAMRKKIASLDRYIATSMVSKHRFFCWVSADVVPANLLIIIAREDDYFLGILESHIHKIWVLAQGTQLREAESGMRYTPTTVFETFPFPWAPGSEPVDDLRVEAIIQAARELVEKRDRWLNPEGMNESDIKKRTLTNLYNERPAWLDLAHKKLDRAVLDAYCWPHDLSDEQILERLLALNLERAAQQGVALPSDGETGSDEDL